MDVSALSQQQQHQQNENIVDFLISSKKHDRKHEFVILEHTLSVLYIPTKAIRNFLNQTDEKNELAYHRMYNGTMTHSLNIRLLKSVNGMMLRGVKDFIDFGVASLNKK